MYQVITWNSNSSLAATDSKYYRGSIISKQDRIGLVNETLPEYKVEEANYYSDTAMVRGGCRTKRGNRPVAAWVPEQYGDRREKTARQPQ